MPQLLLFGPDLVWRVRWWQHGSGLLVGQQDFPELLAAVRLARSLRGEGLKVEITEHRPAAGGRRRRHRASPESASEV